jgi:DNA-binding LacI/PurR family transcriptional regulator
MFAPHPSHRRPTLGDVAALAGVSSATVSRHINGSRHFAPALQARIDAAVASLGYSTNHVARSMVTGRLGAVGLVVLDLGNPHFTRLVKGASRVAAEQGYSVAFVDTAESLAPERHLVESLSMRVDGLVVSARLAGESIDWLTRLGKPVVYFGRLGVAGVHSVSADGQQGAYLLGRHLLERGARQVAYLGFAASRWNAERLQGLADALQHSPCSLSAHEAGAPTAQAGADAAAALLLAAQPPDAVVAYNDLIALGFLHEARRLGVAVPQALSVAGFDDIGAARHVWPPLTSVALHSEALGALAMQRLLQRLAGQAPPAFDETMAPQLRVRASTQRRHTTGAPP